MIHDFTRINPNSLILHWLLVIAVFFFFLILGWRSRGSGGREFRWGIHQATEHIQN